MMFVLTEVHRLGWAQLMSDSPAGRLGQTIGPTGAHWQIAANDVNQRRAEAASVLRSAMRLARLTSDVI